MGVSWEAVEDEESLRLRRAMSIAMGSGGDDECDPHIRRIKSGKGVGSPKLPFHFFLSLGIFRSEKDIIKIDVSRHILFLHISTLMKTLSRRKSIIFLKLLL